MQGLLTFRGNPSRTYYGAGPVPEAPQVAWRYPDRAMCGRSSEYGETKMWCGTGWVGQPAVFERGGRTWLVFGAYDYNFHFVDAATGQAILPPFPTGDIAKGTVTVDPDGFPLVYGGSRDNKLRVLAIDRPAATELWALNSMDPALQPRLWNSDWDAAPLIVGDYLVTGGENSRFHVVKLNRSYGPDGLVQVAPQLVFTAPAWDDELLSNLPDSRVSVENAVTLVGDTAYFTNSGGLLQGWDLSSLRTGQGEPTRTFRFWTGDDTDASIVADEEGYLYVGQEWDRRNERGRQIGQLLKIDPRRPDNPVVWSIPAAVGREERHVVDAGPLRGPRHLADLHRAGVRHRPGDRGHPLDHRAPVRRHELAGRRRRHPRAGRRPGRPPRLRPHRDAARRPSAGPCSCRPTSSPPRPCGRAASTWAPGTASCTPRPTPDRLHPRAAARPGRAIVRPVQARAAEVHE